MKPHYSIILATVAVLSVSGCASSPKARFFVFARDPGNIENASRGVGEGSFIIRARNLGLPAYLDRPQIVSFVAPGELQADEFNRWGKPLSGMVARQVGLTLMSELPDAYVDIHPWRGQEDTAYLLDMNVLRMDGEMGGPVYLEVQWTIVKSADSGAKPIAMKLSRYQHPAADRSIPAYVEAMRLNVEALARDMAAVIRDQRK